MALTEKVTFLLSVNAKGVAREFDKVGRAADKSLGKAEARSEKLSATFTKVGAGMAAAGALAGAALYGMAQDASSMAETVDKAAILFGDGLERVIEFADGAARSIGVAKDEALDAAATFAVYGKRAGLAGADLADFSTELVTAAADMASFNDVPLADTIAAIGSALRGESEPMQKFGFDTRVAALEAAAMEAGIIGVGESLAEAEKPLAVMAAITQQGADQMGNFALTSESAANQAKIMAAEVQNARLELGEAALPVLKEVISSLASMASAFNSLPAPIRSVVAQTAVWGSGLLLVGGAVLSLAGRMKDINAALMTLTAKLNVSKGALAGWGAAAGAAFLAWNAWESKQGEIEQGIDNIAAAMDAAATPVDGLTMHLQGLLATNDDFRKAAEEIGGDVIPRMAAALLEGGDAADAMYEELAGGGFDQAKLPMFFLNLAEDVGKAKDQMDETRAVMSGMSGDSERLSQEIRMLGNRAGESGAAVGERFIPPMQNAHIPVEDLESALSDLNRELSEFFGSIQSAEEAEAGFQEAIDDVSASIEENGKKLGTNTEGARANLAARGAVIDAIGTTVQAMIDEGASIDEIEAKTREQIKAYEDALIASGLSEEKARDYAEALDEIPEQVRTELEQAGWDEGIARAQYYKDLIDGLPREVNTFVNLYGPGSASANGGTASSSAGTVSDPDFELAPLTGLSSDRRPKMLDRGAPGSDGRSVNIVNVVELDGREIARSLERVSVRDGGLRMKLRAGG